MSGTGTPTRGPWNEPLQENADNNTRTGNTINNVKLQQQQNNNGNGGDNNTIDDKSVDDIWSEIKKENSAVPKPGDANYVPPQVDTTTPEQKMAKYLKDQGLETPTLALDDIEKAKNGDFSGIMAAMAAFGQQAHIKAIQSSNTLIDAKVGEAVKKAVGETRQIMSGDKALEALHTALPFTKDPALGPVAQTVMQRFLDRGLTQTEAIEGVKKWRDRFLEKADPNFKKPNPNLNGTFRGNPDQNASEGEMNWIDLLTAKRSGN